MAAKYRKKPIVIEAYKFNPAEKAEYIIILEHADGGTGIDNKWGIATLEGLMEVRLGDWVITGVKGEHYPCKSDIFEMTYELAAESNPPPPPDTGGITKKGL